MQKAMPICLLVFDLLRSSGTLVELRRRITLQIFKGSNF